MEDVSGTDQDPTLAEPVSTTSSGSAAAAAAAAAAGKPKRSSTTVRLLFLFPVLFVLVSLCVFVCRSASAGVFARALTSCANCIVPFFGSSFLDQRIRSAPAPRQWPSAAGRNPKRSRRFSSEMDGGDDDISAPGTAEGDEEADDAEAEELAAAAAQELDDEFAFFSSSAFGAGSIRAASESSTLASTAKLAAQAAMRVVSQQGAAGLRSLTSAGLGELGTLPTASRHPAAFARDVVATSNTTAGTLSVRSVSAPLSSLVMALSSPSLPLSSSFSAAAPTATLSAATASASPMQGVTAEDDDDEDLDAADDDDLDDDEDDEDDENEEDEEWEALERLEHGSAAPKAATIRAAVHTAAPSQGTELDDLDFRAQEDDYDIFDD
jgi:hypothetical protein